MYSSAFQVSPDVVREFYQYLLDVSNTAPSYTGKPNRQLIRLVHNQHDIDNQAWADVLPGDEHASYVNPGALKKAIGLKASIILNEYYRFNPTALQVLLFFEELFSCRVGCNAYMSQQNSQAFPVHFDTHHIIILVLSGSKEWTIYNRLHEAVSAHYKVQDTLKIEEVISQGVAKKVIMSPGDVLYVPIGQYHQVKNLENHSLHLSFSLSFDQMETFMMQLLERARFVGQLNLSDAARECLNSMHPAYLHNEKIDVSLVHEYIDRIAFALKEVAQDPELLQVINTKRVNERLRFIGRADESIINDILKQT